MTGPTPRFKRIQAEFPPAGDMTWQAQGICRDDRDWHQLSQLEQKRICGNCPVWKACLNYALTNAPDDPAVWGGYNRTQRQVLRRRAIKAAREREAAA